MATAIRIERATRVLAPLNDDEAHFAIVQAVNGDDALVVFPDEKVPVYGQGMGKRKTGETDDWRWVPLHSLIVL